NAGTLFKVAPSGALSLLHTFTGGVDGGQPIGLTRAPDGTIFGVTQGQIYRGTPSGAKTTIHNFIGFTLANYFGSITFGPGGSLFAPTLNGIFRGTASGSFTLFASGQFRGAAVGRDGNLYATGNDDQYRDAIFKILTDGTVTVLHTFERASEGGYPRWIIQAN